MLRENLNDPECGILVIGRRRRSHSKPGIGPLGVFGLSTLVCHNRNIQVAYGDTTTVSVGSMLCYLELDICCVENADWE